ncbi:MAG: hypothetical protein IJ618_03805 [Prevotella sp.]|nr:hypothetical protein [Prevotella sp.]
MMTQNTNTATTNASGNWHPLTRGTLSLANVLELTGCKSHLVDKYLTLMHQLKDEIQMLAVEGIIDALLRRIPFSVEDMGELSVQELNVFCSLEILIGSIRYDLDPISFLAGIDTSHIESVCAAEESIHEFYVKSYE